MTGARLKVTEIITFRKSNRPEAHPASCTMGTGSFPGVRCCRCVTLTRHPLLVQRSKGLRGLWKGETYLESLIESHPTGVYRSSREKHLIFILGSAGDVIRLHSTLSAWHWTYPFVPLQHSGAVAMFGASAWFKKPRSGFLHLTAGDKHDCRKRQADRKRSKLRNSSNTLQNVKYNKCTAWNMDA